MRVKTMSILFIISSIAMLTIVFVIMRSESTVEELNCSGNVDILMSSSGVQTLDGDIQITAHIVPVNGRRSYVAEYGKVIYGGKSYIIDRNVRLLFTETKSNGFSEVHREGIDKNQSDTLPDHIAQALLSSQSIFFYRLDKIQNGIWRLSDLRRTIFICKVIS